MGGIAVCIGNYGAYNNGYLIDRWVDLPMDSGDLARLLRDMEAENRDIGAGEEFYVSDYDGTPFGIGYGSRGPFSEHTPIESLNLLAQVMEDHPRECGIVQMALDAGCDCPESVLGLANWILQADDFPVYAYGLDPDVFSATSPEEKMGYSWAVESGLYGMLDDLGVSGFFDFEAYGERMGEDCLLGEDGYVDAALPLPREDLYSWDEIRALSAEPEYGFEGWVATQLENSFPSYGDAYRDGDAGYER